MKRLWGRDTRQEYNSGEGGKQGRSKIQVGRGNKAGIKYKWGRRGNKIHVKEGNKAGVKYRWVRGTGQKNKTGWAGAQGRGKI